METNSDPKLGLFSRYGGQAIWFPVLALLSFGLLFVYSASSVYSAQKYGDEFIFVKKQLLYFIPGILAAVVGARLPLSFLQRISGKIFLASLVLVFLTQVPHIGKKVLGAARWIAVGPVQVQPSEFLKITAVIFASHLLSKKPHQVLQLWPLLLCFFGLLLQPDFGSTVILMLGIAGVVFIHGLPKRLFVGTLMLVLPVFAAIMIAAPYRMRRLVTFLDPFADPLGAGFQVIQSFVAIANGGWFGKGLGGSQQKLFFLPEAHTDFILAVIGEEMGFAGILTITFIYGLLFFAILQVTTHAISHFERLLAAGFFAMIAGSVVVNMGVVAGMLPTKGLTLPLISAGGSSLVANLFIMGLLSQIHKNIILSSTVEETHNGSTNALPVQKEAHHV